MKFSNCAVSNCTILLISFILNYFTSATIPLTKRLSSSLLSKYISYLETNISFLFWKNKEFKRISIFQFLDNNTFWR